MTAKGVSEELMMEIEDQLPDTGLTIHGVYQVFGATCQKTPGLYIHYTVKGDTVDRAVNLGTETRTIRKNFEKWLKGWLWNA